MVDSTSFGNDNLEKMYVSHEKANTKKHHRHCTATELQKMQFNGLILKNNNKNNNLHWATGNCMVSRVRGRWKECIDTKKSVIFIGDSQMRYVAEWYHYKLTISNNFYHRYHTISDIHFFYALNEVHLLNKSLKVTGHPNFDFEMLKFRFATFADNFIKIVHDVLLQLGSNNERSNQFAEYVIIFHWGSWDATNQYKILKEDVFKGFLAHLQEAIHTLNITLENNTFSNVTLIWVTSPSVPYRHNKIRRRNPYDLGSITGLGYDIIKDLKTVKILNMYSITNTINNK